MRILVFDTETTGLPKCKIVNYESQHLWPHIVQFSYVIYDTDTKIILKTFDKIIKMKNDISIPAESSNIHGITDVISRTKGVDINEVLLSFFNDMENINLLVGHNISFDINMLKIELLRIIYNKDNLLCDISVAKYNYLHKCLGYISNYKHIYCTLQDSIDFCNIKAVDKYGKTYLKYPKLSELHEKLFGNVPNNLHNSLNDVLITLKCFMKLKYDVDII